MTKTNVSGWFREKLAIVIVVVSLVVVVVLGGIAIVSSSERAGAADKILTMILPMISTWVGTVLAFYFGKSNWRLPLAALLPLPES